MATDDGLHGALKAKIKSAGLYCRTETATVLLPRLQPAGSANGQVGQPPLPLDALVSEPRGHDQGIVPLVAVREEKVIAGIL